MTVSSSSYEPSEELSLAITADFVARDDELARDKSNAGTFANRKKQLVSIDERLLQDITMNTDRGRLDDVDFGRVPSLLSVVVVVETL